MVWWVPKTMLLQSGHKWKIQQREKLRGKRTTRQLCGCQHLQSVLLTSWWSGTQRLTTKWLCRWPQCQKVFQGKQLTRGMWNQGKMEECLLSIKNWMDQTRLKMNPAKKEFIHFANARQLQKSTISSLNIAGNLILRSYIVRYLGVWMDSTLSFKTHVTKKCQAAMLNYIRIWSICHLLTQEATSSLLLSLCISHLDYCNSILYGLPDSTIKSFRKYKKCVHT